MKSINLKKACWVTLILVFALLYAPISLKVRAAETKEVKVSVVDDISLSTVTRGESSTDYNTVYSFTLDKPAIVKVSAEQSFYKYASLSGANCGVYADSLGTALVKDGELVFPWRENQDTTTTWLEAGTYYIVFKVSKPDYEKNESGITNVGVCAEYIDRTASGNTSYVKAAKLNLNEDAIGFFSSTNRKQYYKFSLNTTSKVNINLLATKITGTSTGYGVYDAVVCDGDFKEIVKKEMTKDGTVESVNLTLAKGTYYVVMDASGSNYYYGITNLKVTADAVKALSAPKVTTYKANTTVVKGTAAAKSKVYVVYNGKTYSATANSKGSFSIKTAKLTKGKKITAYAVKSGVKSKTSSVKVK